MDDHKALSKYDVVKNLAVATGATGFTYFLGGDYHMVLRFDRGGGIGKALETLRGKGWKCRALNGAIYVR